MSNIKFKIAAKTDVGRVRTNNEDNLLAACDLTTAPMKWVNDEECTLGNKGALLVVADGMGGMNAGEVASEIAIETIRDFFSPENITDKVLDGRVGIETFMKKSIIEADRRIKEAANLSPEHKGMGTTIVIGWLLDDKLYVAWCGDSRAYIYNRKNGLRQITKDHSYVQELVDKGTISPDDAFDYPDSNIITRCLCDGGQKARPDTLSTPITVCDGDIVLLCTDGLSGMIRDHEIETVIAENEDDMSACCDELISAACEASGQDNITVDLCKILSGGATATNRIRKNKLSNTISFSKKSRNFISKKALLRGISAMCFIALVFGAGFWTGTEYSGKTQNASHQCDTIKNDTIASADIKPEINNDNKERKLTEVLEEALGRRDSVEYQMDTITFEEIVTVAYNKYDIKRNGVYLLKDGKKTDEGKTYVSKEKDTLVILKK